MTLEQLRKERNTILKNIEIKKNLLAGNNKELTSNISNLKNKRNSILNKIRETQNKVLLTTSDSELKSYNLELKKKCKLLVSTDKELENYKNVLNNILYSNKDDISKEINSLYIDLENNTASIVKAQEQDRLNKEKENKEKLFKGLPNSENVEDFQKVWIDENFGIFTWFPKKYTLSNTLETLFSTVLNKVPEDYISKDDVKSQISNIKIPGLPTLLSTFIDVLMRSLSQGFAKHFFLFKNTIDLLAGFEIGELMKMYIPALPNTIKEIQTFLTQTQTWMMEKMLGPLFDINIPLPKINFNLGSIIPILPFSIIIPSIDPYGYFTKNTEFNKDVNPKDLNLYWLQKMQEENEKLEKQKEEEFKEKRNNKIKEVNNSIKDIDNKLKILNTPDIIEVEKNKLNNNINSLIKQQNTLINEDDLKKNCDLIKKLQNDLKNIENSQLNKKTESEIETEKNILKEKRIELLKSKEALNKSTDITLKDFAKISTVLAYKQNIKNSNFQETVINIFDNGVNVFDNEVTEYLQKVGYDFNTNNIDNLLTLRKRYGIQFNNSTHLKMLYNIGFNFNDIKYKEKLSALKRFNINLLDNDIMSYLIDMGMNLNNNNFIKTLELLSNMGISVNDKVLLNKLLNIGFNFNNDDIIPRLKTLRKYADIKNSISYNNIIERNINLNNPNFEFLLRSYYRIGLKWNDADFNETDEEILREVKIQDIDKILKILSKYKEGNNYTMFKYIYVNPLELNNVKNKSSLLLEFEVSSISEKYTLSEYTNNYKKDDYGFYLYKGSLYNYKNLTYNKIGWLSMFDFDINKYQKYDISINKPQDIYNNNKVKREYVYPNNYTFIPKKIEDGPDAGKPEIEVKLKLLRDYVENNGWKIQNKKIDERLSNSDYNDIVNYGNYYNVIEESKKLTNEQKKQVDTNIPFAKLEKLFNKIGLNIKDLNFNEKLSKLDIASDSDLVLTKVDFLNKIGFNYQNTNYQTLLNTFKGISFDINKYETGNIVNSLNSIGWHNHTTQSTYKLFQLIQFGFDFNIPNIEDNINNIDVSLNIDFSVKNTNSINPSMDLKLSVLNNIGFNFNKPNWKNCLEYLRKLGLSLKNDDFVNAVNELISFEINFNDVDWKSKINKLLELKINFNTTDQNGNKLWVSKLSNLSMLGINFNTDDWLNEYNNVLKLKKLGIDYNDIENQKKLEIITESGIDFNEPESEYMKKLNGLVRLGLVNITKTEEDIKNIKNINNDIRYYESIKNGSLIKENNEKLKKLKLLQYTISLKINNIKNENEKIECCLELNDIEKKIENLKNIKYDIDVDSKLNDLKEKRNLKINNDSKISLASLEKFQYFEKLGLDFRDSNYSNNISKLEKAEMNFSASDWKEKFEKSKNIVPVNVVLKWQKIITKIIITLITLPIKIIIGLISALLNLIKAVITIPLNPTKIDDWAKKIIAKFKELVKMIKDLPSLDGIMNFLFLSASGLMLIDIFVPGFSAFMDYIKNISKDAENKTDLLKNQISNDKSTLTNMNNSKNLRILEINNKLDIINNPASKLEIINKLKNQQKVYSNNIDLLKNTLNEDLSPLSIKNIENELNKNCKKIKIIDKKIKDLEKLDVSLVNKTNLMNDLSNIDELYNTEKLSKDIQVKEQELSELLDKASLTKICKWKDDFDGMIKILDNIIVEEENKINPTTTKIKNKENNIKNIEDAIKKLNDRKNNTDINIQNDIKKIDNQIKDLENDMLKNCKTLSDDELSKIVVNINRLKDLKIQKNKDLNNDSDEDINNNIKLLKNKLEENKKALNNLKNESNVFEETKKQNIENFKNISEKLPTITNILCGTPKFIANIHISIFNSIGYMKNLPSLWYFDLIE